MVAQASNIDKLRIEGFQVISHNEDRFNPWHFIVKSIVKIAKCIPLIGSLLSDWKIESRNGHKYVVIDRSPKIQKVAVIIIPSRPPSPSLATAFTPSNRPQSPTVKEFIRRRDSDCIFAPEASVLKSDIEIMLNEFSEYIPSDEITQDIAQCATLDRRLTSLCSQNYTDRRAIRLSETQAELRHIETEIGYKRITIDSNIESLKATLETERETSGGQYELQREIVELRTKINSLREQILALTNDIIPEKSLDKKVIDSKYKELNELIPQLTEKTKRLQDLNDAHKSWWDDRMAEQITPLETANRVLLKRKKELDNTLIALNGKIRIIQETSVQIEQLRLNLEALQISVLQKTKASITTEIAIKKKQKLRKAEEA